MLLQQLGSHMLNEVKILKSVQHVSFQCCLLFFVKTCVMLPCVGLGLGLHTAICYRPTLVAW